MFFPYESTVRRASRLLVFITAISGLLFYAVACSNLPVSANPENNFVQIQDGRFYLNGEPYYFMGTNLWYGAYLGMEGKSGDRERLVRELDILKENGVTNLRVLAASESSQLQMSVQPAFQLAPGLYNENLLEGLDFLLAEMHRRDMKAVLYLNNFWQWSGGMSQYVTWVSGEEIVDPDASGDWPGFIRQSASFYRMPEAQHLYRQFIKLLITRRNTVTGMAYRDDPTIMSWQLANEPRPGNHGRPREEYQPFVDWIHDSAKYIRELAPHQLISTGSEGTWGSVDDEALYIEAHNSPYIDYLTFHLWVKNWSWFDASDPEATYGQALQNARQYIRQHIDIAERLNKPTVMEEFGVERDDADYRLSSTTVYRDRFYREYFDLIVEQARLDKPVMGVNFWTWGGVGQPRHEDLVWRKGDSFVGDPPQEPQGLNSVFAGDASTLSLIKRYADILNSLSEQH